MPKENDKTGAAGGSGSKQTEKSATYKKWLVKRGNTIKTLEFHAEKLKLNANPTEIGALTRLSQIEATFEKFNNVVKELEEMDEWDENDCDFSNDEVVEIFIQTSSQLKAFTKDHSESLGLSSTHMTSRTHQEVKLPKISIPKFNGEDIEWISFYDAFTSLIDTNMNLPDVSKMHYLRDCLGGTAFSLIGKLPVTETNYRLAWGLLCDRFHNKRAIINAHLKKFINQPQLETANAHKLRYLIDTIRESTQSIETLDVAIKDWDPILVFITESKLDGNTLREWEHHLGGTKEVPSYVKLLEFLETQWRIYDITDRSLSRSNNSNTNRSQSINSNDKTTNNPNEKKICTLCNQDHWISYCQTFDEYDVQNRKKVVRENELCENCLQKHKTSECRSKYRCRHCKGKHHSKLHDETATAVNNMRSTQNLQKTNMKSGKLLATAIVKVKDKFGMNHLLRVFIDQGSEGTIISERAMQILSLPRRFEDMPLIGLNEASLGKANKSV